MLKVRNHREGFSDSINPMSPDSKMLSGNTERSKNIETNYTIRASTGSAEFRIEADSHLILPLFI